MNVKSWTTQTGGAGTQESPAYIALFNADGELKSVTSMGGPMGVGLVSVHFALIAVEEERKSA